MCCDNAVHKCEIPFDMPGVWMYTMIIDLPGGYAITIYSSHSMVFFCNTICSGMHCLYSNHYSTWTICWLCWYQWTCHFIWVICWALPGNDYTIHCHFGNTFHTASPSSSPSGWPGSWCGERLLLYAAGKKYIFEVRFWDLAQKLSLERSWVWMVQKGAIV